jgi:hypothetical protein
MGYCRMQIDLASGCTRAVFDNRARRPKKMLAGVSGHDNDVATRGLEKATLQRLEESARGFDHQDGVKHAPLYTRVWLADQIYDCWVHTMFLVSPSAACVIDLTRDEDMAATGSSSAGEIIDLTI